MAAVSDFVNELRPSVPTVLGPLLKKAIVEGARRFCFDSNVLAISLTKSPVVDAEVIDIKALLDNSGLVEDSTTLANIVQVVGDGDALFVGNDYSKAKRSVITVFDGVDTLSLVVSMQPIRNAIVMPDELFDDWLEPILEAASAYIYSLPAHADGNLYQYHEREYIEKMRSAKREAMEALPHTSFSPRKRKREFF